jgi:hypothetical protein
MIRLVAEENERGEFDFKGYEGCENAKALFDMINYHAPYFLGSFSSYEIFRYLKILGIKVQISVKNVDIEEILKELGRECINYEVFFSVDYCTIKI